MATSNQIALREAKTREEGLRETKRSNKRKEELSAEANKLQRRGQDVKAATDILSSVSKVMNDPAWYRAEPQLVKDVASISFNNPLGGSFNTMFSKYQGGEKASAPGIMCLYWVPSIGKMSVNGVASTADIAAKSLYSYVRYANSGARNYEASDLIMYLLAVSEAYSYYAFLTKLYSLVTTCKSENRYYVDSMVQACGVDVNNLRSNISAFRAYINSYAVRLNSMYIPKDLPYMQRHIWLNSTIFKDSPIKKSQEYMFVQKYFYVYDDIAGKLTPLPSSIKAEDRVKYAQDFKAESRFTFAQLQATGDLLINSLVQSEDAGIMAGDILKAYGEGNMAYAKVIDDDYHIESVYSYEVLTQIHNAMFAGIPTTGFTDEDRLTMYDIKQTTINLVDFLTQGFPYYATSEDATNKTNVVGYGIPCTLGLKQTNVVSHGITTEDSILNFDKDSVTPDDVMVATRFQFGADSIHYFSFAGEGSIQTGCLIDAGSEIMLDYAVFILIKGKLEHYDHLCTILDMSDSTNKAFDYLARLAAIVDFDWHPRVFTFDSGFASGQLGFSDMANYTTISNSVKENLNYVAILSEFGIPKLGLTVRNR